MKRVILIETITAREMERTLNSLPRTELLEDGYPTGYIIDSIESFSVVKMDDYLFAFVLVNVHEKGD